MKNKPILFLFLLGALFLHLKLFSQNSLEDHYRIMFYNVENLFDTEDDPKTIDEEFLPKGDRYWNNKKFYTKLNRISQVVIAAGQGQLPIIVGLCEVENQKVLDLLLYKTPLGKLGYKIIHKESPDERGIDVAMLYKKEVFRPLSYRVYQVTNSKDPSFKTRDILYVTGLLATDTLHVFVNHWPSKYGGTVETKPERALAANTLRAAVDSIFRINAASKIIIMGDFNDSPFDESITQHLKPVTEFESIINSELYNLAYSKAKENLGTTKFHGKWDLIDQMMVSGALLKSDSGLLTKPELFKIFNAPFLLEEDKTYLGKKPFRTYEGFKYHNGFSDHLPVLLDLKTTIVN